MTAYRQDASPEGTGVVSRRPAPGLSLAVLLAGALLVGFSMGSWLAPPAAWIGPVLVMRYARDHGGWRGFALLFVALAAAFIIGFGSMWTSSGWPMPLVVSLPILYGLLWSLPYLADRLLGPRIGGFSSTLVYPLAATTIESVNSLANPIGAWGATGFSQYGNLPVMQLASVTGMIGITFLMGWFASVVNWAWENRGHGAGVRRGLATLGTVLALVLVFGLVRLVPASSGDTIRVAGITAESTHALEEPIEGAPDSAARRLLFQSHWDAYASETTREARAGAELVVWPETAGAIFDSDEASYTAQAQDLAREQAIYLAVPLWTWTEDTLVPVDNKLLVIDPAGSIVIEHVKYGGAVFERTVVGDGTLQTAITPFGVLSGVICWDADYPAVMQQSGQNGTGLLLVPSSDWFEIDPLHTHMAAFRAVENGLSLVRQTDWGLSMAVDPYGRELAQTDFFRSTDRTMIAQVPTAHVDTLYTAFGRWLGWVCLVGFVLVIGWAVLRRRSPG